MGDVGVFQVGADRSHRWLTFVKRTLPPLAMRMDGTSLASTWGEPPAVEEILEDGASKRSAGDYAYLDGVSALSERAANALGDLLRSSGELLPVRSTLGPYYVYNITRIVDALDEERSKIARFVSSGRIMEIESYAFFEDRLAGIAAFRIPQLRAVHLFVTAQFKARAEAAKLTGFRFDRI